MGAPVYQTSAVAHSSGSTTITVTVPGSVQAGWYMLAAVLGSAGSQPTAPAGWTFLQSEEAWDGTYGTELYVYGRTATAGDANTSYTWTFGTSIFNIQGTILAYSSVDSALPVNAHGGALSNSDTTNPTVAAPNVTTTTGPCTVVSFFAFNNRGGGSYFSSVPSTNRINSGFGNLGLAVSDATLTSAGSGGAANATGSGTGPWSAISIALAPFDNTITCTPSAPTNGGTVNTPTPTLQVAVTDADASGTDSVTFTIATDAGLTQNVHTFTTATQNNPLSSATFSATMAQLSVTLSSLTTYYWNATVNTGDGEGSVTTATQSFTTDYLPHAPTLTTPVSGNGYPPGSLTVSWTDNEPTGSSLTQTKYAIKRSADGGSTWHWYNGTDWSSATEVFVTSTSASISTPSWTSQTTAWQVQVATQNTNGAGPYCAAVSFYIHDAPTVTITAPANNGTVSSGGPTLNVTWTYAQAQSLAEANYRVLVRNAALSTTYYDSGWLSGTATTLAINAVAAGIPTDTSGGALKVTVQVQDSDGSSNIGSATNTFDIQWGVITVSLTAPTANQVIGTTSVAATWTASSTRGVSMQSYRVQLSYTQSGTGVFDSATVTPWATTYTPNYILSDFSQYTLTLTVYNANGVAGTATVVFTVSLSDPAAAYTPNPLVGRTYDFGINGVGVVLAPGSADDDKSEKWVYTTIGKPLEPMRFATGETPFAQQIDHYHFTSMTDWRGGAGQNFLERDASVPNGYLDSDGVDPFTPYQLTLLKATATDVATTQNPCFGAVAGSNAYVLTGAAQLKYETAPGGSLTTINLTGPTTVIDMTSDGQQWYVADSTAGIFRGTTADPGASAWSKASSGLPANAKPYVISYAGQRICVGYGSSSGATPNVWSTLNDSGVEEVTNGRLILPAGWTVTKTTGGNGFLFFGAYAGSRGFIYHYQLGSNTTPSVCWELPVGEIPIDLVWYQGQVLVRTAVQLPSGGRQMRIWRCPVDTSGNLTPSVVQTFGLNTDTVDNAAGTWGVLGDKAFFSWYNMDGTVTGIGCLDLAQGGYAKWHKGTALGTVRSIFNYNGRVAFTQDGVGLIMEQSTYRTQGWAKTSLSDQNAVVGKVFDHLYLYSKGLNASESITLDYTLDAGNSYTTFTALSLTATGQRDASALLSQKATSLGVRVWLNGPGTTTPTLYRVTWQVHQFGIADTIIQVPIDCGDYISDMKGVPLQKDSGPGTGMARLRWLQNLLYTRVLVQDLDYQDNKATYVYELISLEVTHRSRYDAREGKQATYAVASTTLRKLAK